MKKSHRLPFVNRFTRLAFLFAGITAAIIPFTPLSAQNIGIGTANPLEKLHVAGTVLADHLRVQQSGQFDVRLAINSVPQNSYRLFVNGGNTFLGGTLETSGSTTVGHNLSVANDGIIENNFRINGRIGIGGATNGNYQLMVNNGNSYFEGNLTATGNASVNGAITAGTNVSVGNNLIVANDAIITENFRVNGRVGINGGTHGSYGLMVNNSNSYFQGNITATGTVAASGNLTIKGNGHVRSAGSSNLRVGFTSKAVNVVINNGASVSVTANITSFEGASTDDARVFVAQVVNDIGSTVPWSEVNITVMGVNPGSGTCLLWLHNASGSTGTVAGTIYLTTIARE